MTHAAFGLYQVRASWLALGAAGRDLAVRGAVALADELAPQVRVAAFVCRGLSRRTDLVLQVTSETLDGVEAYLQRLAVLTAGRHLETLEGWLGCDGDGAVAAGDLVGLYAVRGRGPGGGPGLDGGALDAALPAHAARARWRCAGLAAADHLLLLGAPDLASLRAFHDGLGAPAPFALEPLAVGRRLPLDLALARFGPPAD